jgi:hypothetical protein
MRNIIVHHQLLPSNNHHIYPVHRYRRLFTWSFMLDGFSVSTPCGYAVTPPAYRRISNTGYGTELHRRDRLLDDSLPERNHGLPSPEGQLDNGVPTANVADFAKATAHRRHSSEDRVALAFSRESCRQVCLKDRRHLKSPKMRRAIVNRYRLSLVITKRMYLM